MDIPNTSMGVFQEQQHTFKYTFKRNAMRHVAPKLQMFTTCTIAHL